MYFNAMSKILFVLLVWSVSASGIASTESEDVFLIRSVEASHSAITRFRGKNFPIVSLVLASYRNGTMYSSPISKEEARRIKIISESMTSAIIVYPKTLVSKVELDGNHLSISELNSTVQKKSIEVSREQLKQIRLSGDSLIFVQYHLVGISPRSTSYHELKDWTEEKSRKFMNLLLSSGAKNIGSNGNTFLLAVPSGQEDLVQSLINRNLWYNLIPSRNFKIPKPTKATCASLFGN